MTETGPEDANPPVEPAADGEAEGTDRHDWERHDGGDRFGSDAFDDEQREALRDDGVDPDEFFPSIPHPFG